MSYWTQQLYMAGHQRVSLVRDLKSGMGSRVCAGTHKVFNVGKALPEVKDVEDLKRALMDTNIP